MASKIAVGIFFAIFVVGYDYFLTLKARRVQRQGGLGHKVAEFRKTMEGIDELFWVGVNTEE